MQDRKQKQPGVVTIVAADKSGKQIMEISLPVDDYYNNTHPIIDNERYRSQRGICHVYGEVFDYDGMLYQEFNNEYDLDGSYLRSKIVHSDGTVIED